FEDAKLSTCVFVTAKTDEDLQFRSRVHPGKDIEENSPSLLIHRRAVQLYDPENRTIVACSQEDWDQAVRIMARGRMKRLGECCTAYQGEVNETNDGKKGNRSFFSASISGQALTKRDQGLRGARRGTSRGQGQGGGHAPQKLAEEVQGRLSSAEFSLTLFR